LLSPSRQRITKVDVDETMRVLTEWSESRLRHNVAHRNDWTKLILDSIRVIQVLSPADVFLLSVSFDQSGLSRMDSGIHRDLVATFAELLDRVMRLNCEHLCLSELCSLYTDLLRISVSEQAFVPHRDRVGETLLTRVRQQEEIPRNFPMLLFVETFMQDLDAETLDNLSTWLLRQSQTCPSATGNPHPELVEIALAMQGCFDTLKLRPSERFISAVRKLVS